MGVKGGRAGRSGLILLVLFLVGLLALVGRKDWAIEGELLAGEPRIGRLDSASTLDRLPPIPPKPAARKAADPKPAPFIEPAPVPLAWVEAKPEEPVPDIDLLIRDLAHDNVEGNARVARQKLLFFLRGQRRGKDRQPVVTAANVNAYNMRGVCEEKLRVALFSLDHQQRQLAANILINGLEGPFPIALDAVLVEALRYDPIDGWTCYANNEADATHFFVSHPEVLARSAFLLRGALSSTDGQQRFLAASILCRYPGLVDVGSVCPLLFERLADNDIPGDASMAVQALSLLDSRALPLIEEELGRGPDQQAYRLLQSARAAILNPESARNARVRAKRYPKIYWGSKMSR